MFASQSVYSAILSIVALTNCLSGYCLAQQAPARHDVRELMRSPSQEIAARAQRLFENLQPRVWNYRGNDGKVRTHQSAFHSTFSNSGKLWVKFTSTGKMPLSYLFADDQKRIREIQESITQFQSDLVKHQHLVEQVADQVLSHQLAEIDRQDPLVDIATVVVATNAVVEVAGERRSLRVARGEQFIVLGAQGNFVGVELGGNPAVIPVNAVRLQSVRTSELPANMHARPIVRGQSPDRKSDEARWPRKLDVRWVFHHPPGYPFSIELADVFIGGVGDQMGLKRGDRITRINDHPVTSMQQFRESILAPQPPRFVVQDPFGRSRLVTYQEASSSRSMEGVNGRLNHRQEFIVEFVTQHDRVTQSLDLRRGDAILAVNNRRIRSQADLIREANGKLRQLNFVLLRQGESQPTRLTVLR